MTDPVCFCLLLLLALSYKPEQTSKQASKQSQEAKPGSNARSKGNARFLTNLNLSVRKRHYSDFCVCYLLKMVYHYSVTK
ncbi:hypothetical protein M0804_009297 [Polistes exclamans]|nr:hypothetical protein M0804_009297 [Polistes exclamans]